MKSLLKIVAKKPRTRPKSSKVWQIDGSVSVSAGKPSKPRLPQNLDDFLSVANCVPPLARQMFLAGPPSGQAYDWLRASPIGDLLPPKADALARRSYTPDSLFSRAALDKPEPRDLRFANWCNALRFTINVFEQLLEQKDLFDFSEPDAPRSIFWSPPWGGKVLGLDSRGTVQFEPLKHPLSEFYANLETALTGLDVTRLRRCSAELRGGVKCDRFFYMSRTGKRASRACSPKHGALIRQKKYLHRAPQGTSKEGKK
jgi:hypothetical protein